VCIGPRWLLDGPVPRRKLSGSGSLKWAGFAQMSTVSKRVTFVGTLITRGGGTGAKRVMLANPERAEFIKSFTGWSRVEPGTLTVDDARPLPLVALADVRALATEPANFLHALTDSDKRIAQCRGSPSYYGATVAARGVMRPAILSQQPSPAVKSRLEIIAPEFLRRDLGAVDGDAVSLTVYVPDEWRQLFYGRHR